MTMTRTPRWATALLALTLAVLGGSGVSLADPSGPPVIVDPPGDANSLDYAVENPPDARPASDDGADILKMWPETLYRWEPVGGESTEMRRVPYALRVSVQTTASPRPARASTVMYQLPVEAEGCYISFNLVIPGLGSTHDLEGAEINDKLPDGASVNGGCLRDPIRSPDFTLTFDGTTTRMDFPFASLQGTGAALLVGPGVELSPGAGYPSSLRIHTLANGETQVLAGTIDKVPSLPHGYVIGSEEA